MNGDTWPRAIADQATLALRAFAENLTREQAAELLPLWRFYTDLTESDVDEILARFGSDKGGAR